MFISYKQGDFKAIIVFGKFVVRNMIVNEVFVFKAGMFSLCYLHFKLVVETEYALRLFVSLPLYPQK